MKLNPNLYELVREKSRDASKQNELWNYKSKHI